MALDEIQQKFGGKWKLCRSENFDDLLKEMGVNVVARKLAATGKPEQEVEVKDGKIRILYKTGFWDREDNFILDNEFENETSGVKHKVIASYSDGKLETIATPIDSELPSQRTVRDVVDGEMVMTIYAREVVCIRCFTRL
ncbi:cellular retinoic acid-binding protein 2-like [Haliotis rubra]|uniref:cellular retinoic acid-binding protein 2-like n=1 Tax=Haliotis rubra TaxID=36100 RepID=UPI001EE51E6C|nr:cellular retinoic acid-binding protein 2-like [Haliotis rubra]